MKQISHHLLQIVTLKAQQLQCSHVQYRNNLNHKPLTNRRKIIHFQTL
jgi:hypothetical protein